MPAQAFQLAGFYGLLVPTYDRTNGLSIPIGVDLAAFGSRLRLEPRLTGRSQLGRIDPRSRSRLDWPRGRHRREHWPITYSNDAWISTDIVNSLTTITVGNDTRNYFRGTRGEASIGWRAESDGRSVVGYLGARGEHGLTVRPGVPVTGCPWSFTNREDIEDMFRPNPPVNNGVIASAIAGTGVEWNAEGIVARAGAESRPDAATLDSIAGVPASEAGGLFRPRSTASSRFRRSACSRSVRGPRCCHEPGHHAASTLGIPGRLRNDLDAQSPRAGRRPADVLRFAIQHSD